MYNSEGRKIGFFYNDTELKVENDLSIDTGYNVKIQQERKDDGDYVLSIEIDETKIYNKFNPSPSVLPYANVYFSNAYETSLGSAAIIENVSIIKGIEIINLF